MSDAGEPSGLASLSRSNSYSVREALEAPDQIRSCSNCHLALPVFTLRWHEVAFLQDGVFVSNVIKMIAKVTGPVCVCACEDKVPTPAAKEVKGGTRATQETLSKCIMKPFANYLLYIVLIIETITPLCLVF